MTSADSFQDFLHDNRILIVGISGKIGSGKSTLVETLKSEFDWNVPVYERNFADALKEMLSTFCKEPLESFYSREGKKKVLQTTKQTVGRSMQLAGSAFRNAFGGDVYVWAMKKWIYENVVPKPEHLCDENKLFVERRSFEGRSNCNDNKPNLRQPRAVLFIGDVRYCNELLFVKEDEDGFLVRTVGDPAQVAANDTRNSNHASETELDEAEEYFDVILDTNKHNPLECAEQVFQKLVLHALPN